MKKLILLFLILSLAAATAARATPSASETVAFVHVTVIVRQGTIAEMGDAKRIKIPKDAQTNRRHRKVFDSRFDGYARPSF